MTRLRRDLLFVGAAMTMMAPAITHCPAWFQQVILLLSISTLGIPHGALDHSVHLGHTPARSGQRSWKSIGSFFGGYISSMAIYAALWWISPVMGFLLFLAISAIHFAETDLLEEEEMENNLKWLEHGSYGIMILSFLFIPHLTEVKSVLSSWPALSAVFEPLDGIGKVLELIPWTLLITCMAGRLLRKGKAGLQVVVQTCVLVSALYFLPLLPAFTFYFAWWHSSISLKAIHAHLNKGAVCTIRQMVIKALPLSLLSLMAIGLLLWFGLSTIDFPRMLMGILTSISILTLPHMAIMNTMYGKLNSGRRQRSHPVILSGATRSEA